MRRTLPRNLATRAGIAIAPILFVIAIIGVIIAAFSAGSGSLGGAAIREDRIIADLNGQIDLIRAKVQECVMLNRQAAAPQFVYPGNTQLDTVLAVSALVCPGENSNLWTGRRPASLPQVPKGFNAWQYVNHGNPDDGVSPGGICISIVPSNAAYTSDAMLQAAVKAVLKRYDTSEYTAESTGGNVTKLIIWIKKPATGLVC